MFFCAHTYVTNKQTDTHANHATLFVAVCFIYLLLQCGLIINVDRRTHTAQVTLHLHSSNELALHDDSSMNIGSCIIVINSCLQGSHKPGKPGIVREFCKPGKVREKLGICNMVREFFMRCGIFRELLIYELIFACNV